MNVIDLRDAAQHANDIWHKNKSVSFSLMLRKQGILVRGYTTSGQEKRSERLISYEEADATHHNVVKQAVQDVYDELTK